MNNINTGNNANNVPNKAYRPEDTSSMFNPIFNAQRQCNLLALSDRIIRDLYNQRNDGMNALLNKMYEDKLVMEVKSRFIVACGAWTQSEKCDVPTERLSVAFILAMFDIDVLAKQAEYVRDSLSDGPTFFQWWCNIGNNELAWRQAITAMRDNLANQFQRNNAQRNQPSNNNGGSGFGMHGGNNNNNGNQWNNNNNGNQWNNNSNNNNNNNGGGITIGGITFAGGNQSNNNNNNGGGSRNTFSTSPDGDMSQQQQQRGGGKPTVSMMDSLIAQGKVPNTPNFNNGGNAPAEMDDAMARFMGTHTKQPVQEVVQQVVQQAIQQPTQQKSDVVTAGAYSFMRNDEMDEQFINDWTKAIVTAMPTLTYPDASAGVLTHADGSIEVSPVLAFDSGVLRQKLALNVGGWRVNVQPASYADSDFDTVNSFRWSMRNSVVTNKTDVIPCSLVDVYKKVEAYNEYCANKPGTDAEFLAVHNAYASTIDAMLLGMFTGTSTACTLETRPWWILETSAREALDKVIPADTIESLLGYDDLRVVRLFNREYFMVDSRDHKVNEWMVARRKEIDPQPNTVVDNVSAIGHYYLINPYASIMDGGFVAIEDFYNTEEFDMNMDKYRTLATAGMKNDVLDGEVADEIIGAEPAKLKVITIPNVYNDVTPVGAAERIRDHVALTANIKDKENAVIHGGTLITNNWLLTTDKESNKGLIALQKAIADKSVNDTETLGSFLDKLRDDIEGTDIRFLSWIEARLCKAYNEMFNSNLNFNSLLIEHSFIDEHLELVAIIDDIDTPEIMRVMFNSGVAHILKHLVEESPLSTEDVEQFNSQSRYKIVSDALQVGSVRHLVKDTVHLVKTRNHIMVVPQTAHELHLDPHVVGAVAWAVLPEEVSDMLTTYYEYEAKATRQTELLMVTKDNYVFKITNGSGPLIGGTISVNR